MSISWRPRRPTSRTWSGWRTATAGSTRAEVPALLGLGSNVGDRIAHLRHAVHRLRELGRVTAVSSVYETEPVGFLAQPSFLNLVARLVTTLDPATLLERLRAIEAARGRERRFRDAPRTLDIDILLYGEREIRTPELVVPHPRMRERAFVLVPLLELEPAAVDPVTGERLADALERLDPGGTGGGAGVRRAMSAAALMGEAAE